MEKEHAETEDQDIEGLRAAEQGNTDAKLLVPDEAEGSDEPEKQE